MNDAVNYSVLIFTQYIKKKKKNIIFTITIVLVHRQLSFISPDKKEKKRTTLFDIVETE